jgi:hypothetical protein
VAADNNGFLIDLRRTKDGRWQAYIENGPMQGMVGIGAAPSDALLDLALIFGPATPGKVQTSTDSNAFQVLDSGVVATGTGHYAATIQHWDFVLANALPYMEGQITKYVTRWRKKDGKADLLKARHYLQKLIDWEQARRPAEVSSDTTKSGPRQPV